MRTIRHRRGGITVDYRLVNFFPKVRTLPDLVYFLAMQEARDTIADFGSLDALNMECWITNTSAGKPAPRIYKDAADLAYDIASEDFTLIYP